ncbi:hypothetical protein [Polaromonas sp.]|uniref:hypothetical protein n=1 Tax=Polaromonas sp. TaxID=1869339 RepID=UPI0027310CE5|nr:hypothetical protein [Polaromonas sp.]MDP1886627.1 hypothetical protein [Polaromonas sp.]
MNALTVLEWTPKPPVVTDSHPKQRYFCPQGKERGLTGVIGQVEGAPRSEVEFYRYADNNYVRLSVRVSDVAWAGVHLTAADLRDVARLCLDAAHDLETFSTSVEEVRQ